MATPAPIGAPAPKPSMTKRMEVDNLTFLLERLYHDCSPLQFLRELTQNAIEAIQKLPEPQGEVVWDVEWSRYDLTGTYKLSIVDTGIGMTGEEMVRYINALSSSIQRQSRSGNYGVGAKIAAAPRNPHGLVYLSWKDGVGSMIHLWKDTETEEYGLRPLEIREGVEDWWAPVDDLLKPELIKDHGTMVVLLGKDDDQDTMEAPPGAPTPSQWISRYLNTRYFRFPDGVGVKARQGWEFPRSNRDTNVLRGVQGQEKYLEAHAEARGVVELTGAQAHWWVLRDEPALTQNSGYIASSGHAAALYQDELYEMVTGRAGTARLQQFGVIFGYNRVVLYVEPDTEDGRVTSNTARTQLLLDGEPLPWSEWATEFREKLPEPISDLVSEVAGKASVSDYRESIRERLKAIRDLLHFSRYRRTPRGSLTAEEDAAQGGEPASTGTRKGSGSGKSGGVGGRAGDVYSLFLATQGVPVEELRQPEPNTTWVSVENGTREPPYLEDRAAKYLPQVNQIIINADFRVFKDMTERWATRYEDVPGAEKVADVVVREWFEQQLIEAVMGVMALRGSTEWSLAHLESAWSEEALTAAVMPRYHLDVAVKRAMGAKLGSLKDRKGVA
jgi:hypothetical protein